MVSKNDLAALRSIEVLFHLVEELVEKILYVVDFRAMKFGVEGIDFHFEGRGFGANFIEADAAAYAVEFVRARPNIRTGVPPVLFVLQIA